MCTLPVDKRDIRTQSTTAEALIALCWDASNRIGVATSLVAGCCVIQASQGELTGRNEHSLIRITLERQNRDSQEETRKSPIVKAVLKVISRSYRPENCTT